MNTYIADIIPRIQRFSQKLDNLTMLINQHWVVLDELENSKNVYIFRQNNELLISQNGKVEKAKWEYLGHNSLLIDRKDESFLFKHGFFDENILALKIDSKDEYVFLVNETKFDKELNSIQNVIEFLNRNYIEFKIKNQVQEAIGIDINEHNSLPSKKKWISYKSENGQIEIEIFEINKYPSYGDKIKLNNQVAPDGKYKLGFMHYVIVENGIIMNTTFI